MHCSSVMLMIRLEAYTVQKCRIELRKLWASQSYCSEQMKSVFYIPLREKIYHCVGSDIARSGTSETSSRSTTPISTTTNYQLSLDVPQLPPFCTDVQIVLQPWDMRRNTLQGLQMQKCLENRIYAYSSSHKWATYQCSKNYIKL